MDRATFYRHDEREFSSTIDSAPARQARRSRIVDLNEVPGPTIRCLLQAYDAVASLRAIGQPGQPYAAPLGGQQKIGSVTGPGYDHGIRARAFEGQIGDRGPRRDTVASRGKESPADPLRAEAQKYLGDVSVAAELAANVERSLGRSDLRSRPGRQRGPGEREHPAPSQMRHY